MTDKRCSICDGTTAAVTKMLDDAKVPGASSSGRRLTLKERVSWLVASRDPDKAKAALRVVKAKLKTKKAELEGARAYQTELELDQMSRARHELRLVLQEMGAGGRRLDKLGVETLKQKIVGEFVKLDALLSNAKDEVEAGWTCIDALKRELRENADLADADLADAYFAKMRPTPSPYVPARRRRRDESRPSTVQKGNPEYVRRLAEFAHWLSAPALHHTNRNHVETLPGGIRVTTPGGTHPGTNTPRRSRTFTFRLVEEDEQT